MASISTLLWQLVWSLPILYISHLLWRERQSPLKKIPGPFLAKFTNLWRLGDVLAGRADLTQKHLHAKHGSAVRLGPNFVTLSDPGLIKQIYDARGKFIKSDLYSLNDVVSEGKVISNQFSTRSNEVHNIMQRPILKYFAMTNILGYEPLADETINAFTQKLDRRFADTGEVCDMDDWLFYCAWDMMSHMTFSAPMGFLEAAGDVDGIIAGIKRDLRYFAVVGQIPPLDGFLDKNPWFKFGSISQSPAVKFAFSRIMERMSRVDGQGQRDFLDHYLKEKAQDETIDMGQVLGWLLANVLAGSDSTGITMRAVIYYVLKNPEIHRKLRTALKELKAMSPISYDRAKDISYLNAVISEAIRFHPAVGLPLERVVPADGFRLPDGRYLPPGTIVGMNPWVLNLDHAVYGDDADQFVPERWLPRDDETSAEWEARKRKMQETILTFGAGNRVCKGQNAALMEMYKLTATLFCFYEMELEDPTKEWKVVNWWFTYPSGLRIKIKRNPL